jgi:3-deoxy-D-manno-octulosonic acid kinase
MRVPSGYQADESHGALLIARPVALEFVGNAMQSHGTLYAFAHAHARRRLRGRIDACVIDAPEGTWVVRHYVRGGAIAGLLGDRYLRVGPRRPYAELWTSARARARGIDTPAVAAVAIYTRGPFYRGDIATELVPDAADLAEISSGPSRRSEAERLRAWEAAGRLVRAIGQAGLIHADLNVRNILIAWRDGLPRAHLLDLDRCRIVRRVSPRDLAAMVRRLYRSARKLESHDLTLQAELDAFRAGLRV